MNNTNENDDSLLKLYTLSEIAYETHLKDSVAHKESLYPEDWYSLKDYKEKIEILGEAIKTNCLIINTSRYQELINDLKNKKYTK